MLQTLAMIGLVALAQPATPAAEGELGGTVRRLVRQLDAPQAAERAKAEEALLELGPDALDLLPDVDPQKSPQVAHVLGRVREQLERRLAEEAARPSLVTITHATLPLADVLAAVEKQTGNRLRLDGDVPEEIRRREVQARFDKTPFWQALDRVLDEAGLTIYPYAEGPELAVVLRPEHHLARRPKAVYVGPFRFAPVRVVAQRELRASVGDHMTLTVEAAWEPRLSPIVLKLPMGGLRAVDDKGAALEVGSPEAETAVTVNPGQTAAELEIALGLPPRGADRIASLKGTLSAVLPGKVQKFRFGGLADARNAVQRRAGVTLTLREARKNNDVWQVLVLVRYDQAGEAFQSHYGWFYRNKAWLENGGAKRIESGGIETFRRTETEVGLAYLFDLEGPIGPYSFVYETPGLLLSKEFAFEIKDVKLP